MTAASNGSRLSGCSAFQSPAACVKRRPWAWVVLLAGSGVLYWLVVAGNGLYALYVPPAAIPAALFIFFARSLRPGHDAADHAYRAPHARRCVARRPGRLHAPRHAVVVRGMRGDVSLGGPAGAVRLAAAVVVDDQCRSLRGAGRGVRPGVRVSSCALQPPRALRIRSSTCGAWCAPHSGSEPDVMHCACCRSTHPRIPDRAVSRVAPFTPAQFVAQVTRLAQALAARGACHQSAGESLSLPGRLGRGLPAGAGDAAAVRHRRKRRCPSLRRAVSGSPRAG